MKSIAEILLVLKDNENKGIYYTDKEEEYNFVSYKSTYEKCISKLFYLQQKGYQKGDYLILLAENKRDMVEIFWTCMLGGIIPIPLPIGLNQEQIEKVLNVYELVEDCKVYCSKENKIALENELKQMNLYEKNKKIFCDMVLKEELEQDMNSKGFLQLGEEEETALIQFSSGSTDNAKGVVLSHKNLFTNIRDIAKRSESTDKDVFFSWLPLTHDMGMIGLHIWPMYQQSNLILMDTGLFLQQPLLWMSGCSRFQATIGCAPNFGFDHLLSRLGDEKYDWDLSNLRIIFNGSEPINVNTVKSFYDALEEYHLGRKTIKPSYGMAEATLAVTIPKPDQEITYVTVNRNKLEMGDAIEYVSEQEQNAIHFGSCGMPLDSFELKIVDENNREVEDGIVGSIILRGECRMSGYYRNEEMTKEVITEDGWLISGDLGFSLDNNIYIVGRQKDVIILNGVNYYSFDLERICTEIDFEEEMNFVAASIRDKQDNSEKLAVFIVYKGNLNAFSTIAAKVRETLSSRVGIRAQYIIPVDEYYKTASGKIQRFKYARAFHNGDYEDVILQLQEIEKKGEHSELEKKGENALKDKIIHILKEELKIQEVDEEENLSNMGVDSVKLMNIFHKVNELTPKKIELSDFYDHPTVKALSDLLLSVNNANEEKKYEMQFDKNILNKIENLAKGKSYSAEDIIYATASYTYMFLQKITKIEVKKIGSQERIVELDSQQIDSKNKLYELFAGADPFEADIKKIYLGQIEISVDWMEKKVTIHFNHNQKIEGYCDALTRALENL